MFEKVNPSHPDKIADRISGAVVDLCYTKSKNPKVACEVLIGHGQANIQVETSEQISAEDCEVIVSRIAGEGFETRALIVPQDIHLAANQQHGVKCGDNGIFRGVPPTHEQKLLTAIAATMWERFKSDGKYLISDDTLTICQSKAWPSHLNECLSDFIYANGGYVDTMNVPAYTDEQGRYSRLYTDRATVETFMLGDKMRTAIINPLGEWTGGPDTDSGATNRKLGSDMGDGVTGGGLHGKDLSKADVSVNIWCYLESIRTGHEVTASCSIGDETVKVWSSESNAESHSSIAESRQSSPIGNGIPYKDIVEQARLYIHTLGGFEKFAEWGLVRPLAQV